jgi:magnesium-transporting ATPase (P-type)
MKKSKISKEDINIGREYLNSYFESQKKKAKNKKNMLLFGTISILLVVLSYLSCQIGMFVNNEYLASLSSIFFFTMSFVSMFITVTCYDNRIFRPKPITKFGETIIFSLLFTSIIQLVLETTIALIANINNYMLYIANYLLALVAVGCICAFMWFINYMLVFLYTKYGEF